MVSARSATHMIIFTRLLRFSACNIEKLRQSGDKTIDTTNRAIIIIMTLYLQSFAHLFHLSLRQRQVEKPLHQITINEALSYHGLMLSGTRTMTDLKIIRSRKQTVY